MTVVISVVFAMLLGMGGALQVGLLGAMSRQRGSIEAVWVSILGSVLLVSLVFTVQSLLGVKLSLPAPYDSWIPFAAVFVATGALLVFAIAGLPLFFVLTGMLAAPYLIGASYLTPRLGVGLFLGSIIAGQLICALILDHVGAFGTEVRPIDVTRLLGAAALLLGVILIRGVR
jgi:transporter family-2 protein